MGVNTTGGSLDFEASIDEDGKFQAGIKKMEASLNSLRTKAESYGAIVGKTFDPAILAEYNRKLQETEAEIKRLENVGKEGFDELGNAVGKSTNYFQKAWSGLRQLAYALPGVGVAGIIAFATGPIVEYISNLDIFKKKTTDAAEAQKTLSSALATTDYTNAVKNVNELAINIDLAKQGLLSKTEVLKEYNDTIGKTTGQVQSLDDAEKALTKNADSYVQMMLYKAAANLALEDAAKKSYEAEQSRLKSLDDFRKTIDKQTPITFSTGGGTYVSAEALQQQNAQAERFAKERKDAEVKISQDAADKQLQIAKDFQKKAAEVAKANKFDLFSGDEDDKKEAKADQEALKRRTDLLNQISQVEDSYNRKSLTKNQAEIQAVNDRFKDLATRIKQFNDDPANKGYKIDDSKLDTARQSAIDTVTAQQQVEAQKVIIAQQKQVFKDYEDFKVKAGQDAADKLYSQDLKGFKTYKDFLKSLQPDENDVSAKANAMRDLLKNLNDQADAEDLKRNSTYLNNLVLQSTTYEQKRQAIIEKGIKDKNDLLAKGYNDEAAQAIQNTQDELTALDEAQIKKLAVWKELFSGIYNLTSSQTKKDIAAIQKYIDAALKAGTITKEVYDTINKQLNDKRLQSEFPEDLAAIGAGLKNIASAASAFDENLSKALDTAGQLISATASIKGNINTLSSSSSSITDKISAGFGLVGTAIGVVSTIVGLFDHSKEAAEQQQYATNLQLKATEAINKAFERQLDLTKQIYGPERISGYIKQLKDINDAIDSDNQQLAGRYSLTGNKAIDDELNKRNNGEKGNPLLDSFIQQIEDAGAAVDLTKQSVEQLQALLDQGKLDDRTAAIVQSLIDLQQQARETQDALTEDLTGTSFDELEDGIVSLFQNLTTSAQDFSDNFQKIIQTGLINSFKREYLENQLHDFYDEFYKLTNSETDKTLSADDVAKLQQMYDDIIKNAEQGFQQIQKISGVDFSNGDSSSQSSITGQIQQAITEDTGTKLYGVFNGVFLNTNAMKLSLDRQNALMMQGVNQGLQTIDFLTKIEMNTFRGANNTDGLITALKSIENKIAASGSALTANGR